jgi:hypothetical protein
MNNVNYYQKGNKWQQNRYRYMSDFVLSKGIKDFEHALGGSNKYYHLIPEKHRLFNFLEDEKILNAVLKRFEKKAGDRHRVLTNTVASQACCFNLFVPLQHNLSEASIVFSKLLEKPVTVDEIIIEFTPARDESLGDQSETAGTDSDVAVFYTASDKKGVILIEFKYIEDEFSRCTTYKNNTKKVKECQSGIRAICDHSGFFKKVSASSLCGYMKYDNWVLTQESEAFDYKKVVNSNACPFRFSMQQLWRNMLLAEKVKKSRNLDEFHFWVISPLENTYLWNNFNEEVYASFTNLLSPSGRKAFREIHLHKFFELIDQKTNDGWFNSCMIKFAERYLTETNI